jgi:hypothetical protein
MTESRMLAPSCFLGPNSKLCQDRSPVLLGAVPCSDGFRETTTLLRPALRFGMLEPVKRSGTVFKLIVNKQHMELDGSTLAHERTHKTYSVFCVMFVYRAGRRFFRPQGTASTGGCMWPLILEQAQEMELPYVSDPWLADKMSEDNIFRDVSCKGKQESEWENEGRQASTLFYICSAMMAHCWKWDRLGGRSTCQGCI